MDGPHAPLDAGNRMGRRDLGTLPEGRAIHESAEHAFALYAARARGEPVATAALTRYSSISRDNDVSVVVDRQYGQETLPAIEAAQRSIFMHVLTIDDSPLMGRALVDRLVALKTQRPSLEIRVIVEGFNSQAMLPWSPSARNLQRLRAAGIECFIPCDFVRNLHHRKVVVVDGKTAFVGGASFGAEYAYSGHYMQHLAIGDPAGKQHVDELCSLDKPTHDRLLKEPQFHDVSLRIEGTAAAQLQASILEALMMCGSTLEAGLCKTEFVRRYFPSCATDSAGRVSGCRQRSLGSGQPVKVASSAPWDGCYRETFLSMVGAARKTLDVSFPYLSVPEAIDALVAAAERGVSVRLLLPGRQGLEPSKTGYDYESAYYATRANYHRLLGAGVKIYEFRGYNHGKVMVADGETTWVSSGNPNPFSWYVGFDSTVIIRDRGLAGEVAAQVFEPDFDVSAGRSEQITEAKLDDAAPMDRFKMASYNSLANRFFGPPGPKECGIPPPVDADTFSPAPAPRRGHAQDSRTAFVPGPFPPVPQGRVR